MQLFVYAVISQTQWPCCSNSEIYTIEFGLGQDATTDDKAILLIAHVESRDRRMMRYLYMDEVLHIKRSVLLKAETKSDS